MQVRPLGQTPGTLHILQNRNFDLICDALHESEVSFAVYEGKPAITRKPTILAMEKSGTPLAYAKIGWNPLTREMVEREYHTLRLLQKRNVRSARFAEIVDFLDAGHTKILLSSPLRGLELPPSLELTPLHITFLQEIGALDLHHATLPESVFWQRICSRFSALSGYFGSQQIEILERSRILLERRFGSETFPWMLRLGDVLPWNFRADAAAGRIELVDLEFAEPDSSAGWDLFHFLIGIRRRLAPIEPRDLRKSELIGIYFRHFNIQNEAIPLLQLAYLLDLTFFYRNMWGNQELSQAARRNQDLRVDAIREALLALTA
jgi:hypothetical protein